MLHWIQEKQGLCYLDQSAIELEPPKSEVNFCKSLEAFNEPLLYDFNVPEIQTSLCLSLLNH